MSDAGKAVFLSYASQDAEAAKRICDALRSSGVEVWFDAEGGLEHGDEWDAKIRKQIKECVLFIPLISANTEAREEGYFRIEWDLAAERARGIASGVAFILPVVIDDTRDAEALVPDRFRAVQWTKLRGGEMTPEVKQRFLKLWSHRAGVVKHRSTENRAQKTEDGPSLAEASEGAARSRSARAAIGGPGWKTYAGLAAGVALVVALLGWWFGRNRDAKSSAAIDAARPVATAAAEFPRDPELKRAVKLILSLDAIETDYALAEDIVKPVVASRPNDPEVVTVAAMVAQEYLTRGFDTSDARRATVQKLVERAVQLAPDNPDALAAMGRYLAYMRMQLPRAEELLRRAIELRPDEPRYYRYLLEVLTRSKTSQELEAFMTQMVARFPTDALVRYDLARSYKDRNDVTAMEKALDETVALGPVAFAYVWKSWVMLAAHGDVAGMKAALDRVPDRQRANARVANAFSAYGTISGDTREAIKLVDDLPDTWLSDFNFNGPKALLLGDLLTVANKKDSARLQYDAALAEIQREKARNPTNLILRSTEMWTLLGLGRHEEAHALLPLVLEVYQRPYRVTLNSSWRSGPIRASLLLGERDQALALLKEAAIEPQSRLLLRNNLKTDPQMAPFRDDPAIKALLAEPVGPSTDNGKPSFAKATEGTQKTENNPLVAIDAKSVAVLAFANLSDDKANEYFSDGISEELLNVLTKIPDLKVTARTSSFFFKGKDVPIPEIAQKLGVAYVVEGSVRRQGDKVRITAQLIKAADGFHVWSDTFTRDLKDIFAVQDEIAGLIAQNLSVKLAGTGKVTREVNPEAHRLVLEGRHFWNLRNTEGFDRAEAAFRRAIALAPDYAAAHAGLANVLGTRLGYAAYEGETNLSYEAVRAAATRAIELDPTDAQGYPALALALTNEGRYAEARKVYQKALALNPNYALPHHWLSLVFELEGRIDEALVEINRGVELDPLSGIGVGTQARMLQEAGRYAEAFATYERAAAILPDRPTLSASRAICLLKMNRRDEAAELARKATASTSRELRLVADADAILVLRQTGHESEAAAHAERALALLGPRSYQSGAVLAAMGRFDEALPYLERTPINMQYTFYWNPVWDAWREDPRFLRLLEKFGRTKDYQLARETLARLQAASMDGK